MEKNRLFRIWLGVLSVCLLVAVGLTSCANKGAGPQGGPRDERAPRVVSCAPANGAVNWQKKKVEIEFDENIQVEKANENVVISPAQKKFPSILAVGKKLQINFVDTLQPNTTYTLDFGSAVKDNNEGNVLEGYSFCFSTGDGVDTLQVSGRVLDALTQKPQKNVYVGLYREDSVAWQDSIFLTKNLERIGKTNEEGVFRIIGIAPGQYRVFALEDKNKNYRFDRGEALAMMDSLVTPYATGGVLQDTIWRDSVTVDTVLTKQTTLFYPNNLSLRLFKESKKRQYLVRTERPDSTRFVLKFNTTLQQLPELRILGQEAAAPLRLSINETRDSLVYWLTEPALVHQDSLYAVCTYEMSDSVFNLTEKTDTLKLICRRPQLTEKAKKMLEKKGVQQHFLKVSTTASTSFNLTDHLYITSEMPLDSIVTDSMRLWEIVNDSTKNQLPLVLETVDSAGLQYEVVNEWQGGMKYSLEIDSAALTDVYGHVNKAMKAELKVREKEEYATLTIKVVPFDSKMILQLLDAKGNLVQSQPASEQGTLFEYLLAGEYSLRCFKDEDGDGEWTTGDYFQHRQPEEVIYYPDTLTLRANWEFEETWSFK